MMISKAQLKTLRENSRDFNGAENLVDIRTVGIEDSLDKPERISRYITAVQNPYLFKVGETAVRVQYGDKNLSLQKTIADYLARQ